MKTLVEKLNFSKMSPSLEPNRSPHETLSLTADQRVTLHCYDTFCLYCADNNINTKDFSNREFANAAEIFEDAIKSDFKRDLRFWID